MSGVSPMPELDWAARLAAECLADVVHAAGVVHAAVLCTLWVLCTLAGRLRCSVRCRTVPGIESGF